MRLDLLLQREDFPRIFEQSLPQYLLSTIGVNATVTWRSGFTSESALLVNRKLNVIYPKSVNRSELRLIASEYAYHPNMFRRFLQKTYIRLATCGYFERLFVKEVVEIKPWVKELAELCIIPGNHTIRVIDFKTDSCKVFVKHGFNLAFIKNDINLREAHDFLPIPKLLSIDPDYLYYEEQRVCALPLNRIESSSTVHKMLLQAQQCLLVLYEKTIESVNLDDHVESLRMSCNQLVEALPQVYTREDKTRIGRISKRLTAKLAADDVKIDLVQSHGDFQPANILSDKNGRLYLIDWEYTAVRSVYYDALVFATQCRSPRGLCKRIENLKEADNTPWNWCVKNTPVRLPEATLTVFLLEDLVLKLSELQIPLMTNRDRGLHLWIEEVEQMNWLMTDE